MKTLILKPATLIIALLAGFYLTSCDPKDPEEGEEEITTVQLTFDKGVGTISWEEGQASVPTIRLDSGDTYQVSATFLNESDPSNVEDITEEIKEEDDEHIVCYEVSGADATITRTDSDGQFEVGLETEWKVGGPSNGVLVLKLRHQPGVKDGGCTAGDSDVEVEFNLEIQ